MSSKDVVFDWSLPVRGTAEGSMRLSLDEVLLLGENLGLKRGNLSIEDFVQEVGWALQGLFKEHSILATSGNLLELLGYTVIDSKSSYDLSSIGDDATVYTRLVDNG